MPSLKRLARRASRRGAALVKRAAYRPLLIRSPLNPLVRVGIRIAGPDESAELLVSTEKSLARFGDGEFTVLMGLGATRFQDSSADLAARLAEVLASDREDLLIGLPICLQDTHEALPAERVFWGDYLRRNGRRLLSVVPHHRTYADAQLTRPFVPYGDRDLALRRFARLQVIWKDRDILMVEGEMTRAGIGNDLFDGARSVRRIICPATDAYAHLEEIVGATVEHGQGRLVLCSLGPTATVVAHDASARGVRCLDLGHLDLEYMWALAGTPRVPLRGRYVNEILDQADSGLLPEEAALYDSQIIARIGVAQA